MNTASDLLSSPASTLAYLLLNSKALDKRLSVNLEKMLNLTSGRKTSNSSSSNNLNIKYIDEQASCHNYDNAHHYRNENKPNSLMFNNFKYTKPTEPTTAKTSFNKSQETIIEECKNSLNELIKASKWPDKSKQLDMNKLDDLNSLRLEQITPLLNSSQSSLATSSMSSNNPITELDSRQYNTGLLNLGSMNYLRDLKMSQQHYQPEAGPLDNYDNLANSEQEEISSPAFNQVGGAGQFNSKLFQLKKSQSVTNGQFLIHSSSHNSKRFSPTQLGVHCTLFLTLFLLLLQQVIRFSVKFMFFSMKKIKNLEIIK